MGIKGRRNSLTFYYDTLGLKNVDLRKALETGDIKDDQIGSVSSKNLVLSNELIKVELPP